MNSNIYDAEISLDGFEIFRSDRGSGKIGGGSCVYVKNSMIANNLADFVIDDCLALKIVNYSVTIIILLIHRSPSLINEHSIQLIDQMNLYLESLPSDYSTIIVGDLNLPNFD